MLLPRVFVFLRCSGELYGTSWTPTVLRPRRRDQAARLVTSTIDRYSVRLGRTDHVGYPLDSRKTRQMLEHELRGT